MHQYVESLMQCVRAISACVIQYSSDDQLTDIDTPVIAPCSKGGLYHRNVGAKDSCLDNFS
jgi:hypothetical protein